MKGFKDSGCKESGFKGLGLKDSEVYAFRV